MNGVSKEFALVNNIQYSKLNFVLLLAKNILYKQT